MGVSKVVFGDDTLVDLTGDTVTPTSLTLGATAHGADGEPIVGEYQYVLPPMSSDTRGGARIQPDSGLEITDTDNLQVRLALESGGTVRGGIAKLTAKGHAEQDGTPSPDNPVPIQVVRGRNLIDESNPFSTGTYVNNRFGVTTDANYGICRVYGLAGKTVTYSVNVKASATLGFGFQSFDANGNPSNVAAKAFTKSDGSTTFKVPDDSEYIRMSVCLDSSIADSHQLTLGSTPQPYVPYGHVGMEMRDPDTDELISCTALPLPQRGWVAGLPDGTADALRLDGAGKCEWTLPTSEVVLDGSSDENWNQQDVYTNNARYSLVTDAAFNKSNGGQLLCSHLPEGNAGSDSANIDLHGSLRMIQMTVPYLTVADFKTWLSTHNVTVLYPLATPVTEECGYCEDWPTDIPEGAVITIPELDALNIKYFIDSAVTELARQWYARAYAELGDAVTELAGRVAALES